MSHNYYNFRIAGKFGGLAVYITTTKLKSAKISYLHNIIRMAIPYRTAEFNIIILLLCCNILAIAILGSTAKFNSRQYFRLYDIWILLLIYYNMIKVALKCVGVRWGI